MEKALRYDDTEHRLGPQAAQGAAEHFSRLIVVSYLDSSAFAFLLFI